MTDRLHVLVLTYSDAPVPENAMETLQRAAPGAEIRMVRGKESTEADHHWAHVIFGAIKREWVLSAPHLRWLQLRSAGADKWGAVRSDVLLTKASGAYGVPISEWVVGSLLMLTRNLHLYRDHQRQRLWKHRRGAREINGGTVGIVGLGDLGQQVALRLRAFGCKILGHSRRRPEPAVMELLDAWLPLEELVTQVDFLVLAVPGTPATAGLMSRDRLLQMRPGSYLINVGRGSAIDEAALHEVLVSGHLAGAALDVTAVEPLPEASPLWQLEQVVIAPHVSGDSPSGNGERLLKIFAENLRRFAAGEPLLNLVDRSQGY